MTAMRVGGNHHKLPQNAHLLESDLQYVIQLDVSDFTRSELAVEVLGPQLTVRGDQLEAPGDETQPFCLHERFERSFRLPDDADRDGIQAFDKHGALEIRVPRLRLEPQAIPIERRRVGLVQPDAEPV